MVIHYTTRHWIKALPTHPWLDCNTMNNYRTLLYNKVTVLAKVALSITGLVYLLVVSQASSVYPAILTSLFILVLWGACEMPVILCCDSGWAMALSCSGAPIEVQFPFVLWCIDPFRPPPACTPLVLTLLKLVCAMDLCVVLAYTRQPGRETPLKSSLQRLFSSLLRCLIKQLKPEHLFF